MQVSAEERGCAGDSESGRLHVVLAAAGSKSVTGTDKCSAHVMKQVMVQISMLSQYHSGCMMPLPARSMVARMANATKFARAMA